MRSVAPCRPWAPQVTPQGGPCAASGASSTAFSASSVSSRSVNGCAAAAISLPVSLLHAGQGRLPLKVRSFLDYAAPYLRAALAVSETV